MLPVPKGHDTEESYISALLDFLKSPPFHLLTSEVHHLDILLPEVYARLPDDWTLWLESAASEEELNSMLSGLLVESVIFAEGSNRPPSLESFLRSVSSLSLPQKDHDPDAPLLPIPLATTKGMVQKKLIEVGRLGRIIKDAADQSRITNIVDVGCGQGYLSRTLADACFNILGIDSNPRQLVGSRRFGSKAASRTNDSITYLEKRIVDGSTAREEISSWLDEKGGKGLITCLHACGSLVENILGCFLLNEGLRKVVAVGCCYNHLQSGSFPSSRAFEGVALTSTAKMAACQTAGRWSEVEGHSEARALQRKRTHYRRLLTVLLHCISSLPTTLLPLGAVPTSSLSSFADYAVYALEKLELIPPFQTELVRREAEKIEGELGGWRYRGRGRFVELLVKQMGSLIESAIAIDRYLFLKEHDLKNVSLAIGWDYSASPRNIIIQAEKG